MRSIHIPAFGYFTKGTKGGNVIIGQNDNSVIELQTAGKCELLRTITKKDLINLSKELYSWNTLQPLFFQIATGLFFIVLGFHLNTYLNTPPTFEEDINASPEKFITFLNKYDQKTIHFNNAFISADSKFIRNYDNDPYSFHISIPGQDDATTDVIINNGFYVHGYYILKGYYRPFFIPGTHQGTIEVTLKSINPPT